MPNTHDRATKWPVQEQMVSSVRQSQQATVDAIGAWAKAVETLAPRVSINHYAQLPTPAEWVDWYFEFAQRLVDAQHEFARNAIGAVRPLFERAAEDRAKEDNGDLQRDLAGLRLEALTVKDLDRLAEASNVEEYPQDAPKAEKIAALQATVPSN